VRRFSRPWEDALDTDWCHALGQDANGLLLWRTVEKEKWEDVLHLLAEVKIAFRTQFYFKGGGRHHQVCDRQVIAYPVTNHPLDQWGKDARSANQVLFKVLSSGNRYVGVVAHLPHGLPAPLRQRLSDDDRAALNAIERRVWRGVHKVLDERLTRLP
jgi:CRISPR-associated protein Cmr1